ncbi:UNVERIFIED_ORG: general secretion pathway protein J [Zoogloea ramigera]|uniref:Prepilin-type N-terminal cleavage/methylation domain-containing protein n=1 Tax=Duganella zoogloeoides TaxID=75659 RepID=A0ABZ0XYC3_9BURK|nr:prepilin-type N-terminal cleavage/methylation domain-containing protein [Duganella zoogloeoides]WQH04262.1 prepilin-type N-terminal cleavage/methylation domain-containing protein [Duganella zoogloeoides]
MMPQSMPKLRPRPRGFTLIELLVAITILAFVAVLGWRGLDGIIRSRDALTTEMAYTRGLQLAFAQLQSDLSSLANSSYLNRRPMIAAENDRITLVRMAMLENEPTRLLVVSYRVRDDGVLVRRESNATRDLRELDTLWQAALSDTGTSASVALQSGVQAMTMRYWADNQWLPASGTAPVSGTGMPTGLEVTLMVRGQEVPLVKSYLLGEL